MKMSELYAEAYHSAAETIASRFHKTPKTNEEYIAIENMADALGITFDVNGDILED